MNVCAHGTRWLAAAACLALCVSFRLAAADPLPSPSFGQIPLTFEPNRVRPIDRTRVRMTLAGAQPSPVARGVDEQPGRVSYPGRPGSPRLAQRRHERDHQRRQLHRGDRRHLQRTGRELRGEFRIKITAVVPAGATTGKIAVTTSAGTATSAANFTVP